MADSSQTESLLEEVLSLPSSERGAFLARPQLVYLLEPLVQGLAARADQLGRSKPPQALEVATTALEAAHQANSPMATGYANRANANALRIVGLKRVSPFTKKPSPLSNWQNSPPRKAAPTWVNLLPSRTWAATPTPSAMAILSGGGWPAWATNSTRPNWPRPWRLSITTPGGTSTRSACTTAPSSFLKNSIWRKCCRRACSTGPTP